MTETDERIVEKKNLTQEVERFYKQEWDKRGMRLGQHLINNLAPIKTKAPEIFYETDDKQAVKLFIERYVIGADAQPN